MKKYLDIVVILCSLLIVFKGKLPAIFNSEFIQVPVIIIFGVLTPVAFAVSLQKYFFSKKLTAKLLFDSSTYLLSFLIVLLCVQFSYFGANSTFYNLSVFNDQKFNSSLFEGLAKAESTDVRENLAKIIYSEYGGKVPYLAENGIYKVYEPKKDDVTAYLENKEIKSQVKELRNNVRLLSFQSILASVYLMASFFIFFSATMYYQQNKANKNKHRKI